MLNYHLISALNGGDETGHLTSIIKENIKSTATGLTRPLIK